MITKMESSLDLSKKILGITLESVIPTKIGKGLKINIPVLMSKITKEEPKKSPLYSKGTSVFINASDCKPQAKTNLHEINYLVAARESNASLNEILVKKEDGKTYEIPKGTKLETQINFQILTKKVKTRKILRKNHLTKMMKVKKTNIFRYQRDRIS